MKTASVADLRNNFATVSHWIHEGESVTIKKRGTPFAILSPVRKMHATPVAWPAFEKRMRHIFPDGTAKGTGAEKLVDQMRGNY